MEIGRAEGDGSVLPAGRTHALRIRTDRTPVRVTLGGRGVPWHTAEAGCIGVDGIPAGATVVVAWR